MNESKIANLMHDAKMIALENFIVSIPEDYSEEEIYDILFNYNFDGLGEYSAGESLLALLYKDGEIVVRNEYADWSMVDLLSSMEEVYNNVLNASMEGI